MKNQPPSDICDCPLVAISITIVRECIFVCDCGNTPRGHYGKRSRCHQEDVMTRIWCRLLAQSQNEYIVLSATKRNPLAKQTPRAHQYARHPLLKTYHTSLICLRCKNHAAMLEGKVLFSFFTQIYYPLIMFSFASVWASSNYQFHFTESGTKP